MDTNPNLPIEPSPGPLPEPSEPPSGGRPLPFEDPAGHPGFLDRVGATVRLFWTDTAGAGEGLGSSSRIGPAIGFYALLGLPAIVLAGVTNILWPVQPWFLAALGQPKPAAPEGSALVIGIFSILLAPAFIAVALALTGLLYHGGLWLVGGAKAQLGLPVTFRALLYSATALGVPVGLAELALSRVPGPLHILGSLLAIGAQLGIFFYQGVIFARAHRTDTWRGVLGMLMPILLLLLLCGGCFGALWIGGGEEFRDALAKGLRGGA